MKQRIALVGGILCVHPVCGLEMATQMISFQLKEERGGRRRGGEEKRTRIEGCGMLSDAGPYTHALLQPQHLLKQQ